MKNLFTILAAALLTANLWAQSPEKISYQAIIRNSSSQLVTNHSIGMQISILKGSETGTAVFTERHFPTTNANGLVSIVIGTGTLVSGSFTTIDWAADSYFLKTETDINGGSDYTITGTSQLLSVPYAFYAKTAENITGTITETDPVFGAWNKSTGISITESQISDLKNYLTSEVDGSVTNEIQNLENVLSQDNSAGNKNITNLANPVNNQDAVTKAYVDANNGILHKNSSIYIGDACGINSTSSYNVMVGDSAGYWNTTGDRNTALGYQSLFSNTEGLLNTAIGHKSLYSNISGRNNTSTGHRSLYSNLTGSNNVAYGFYALHNNTTGYSNIAIGTGALRFNTDRSNLVAIGDSALFWNGTGTITYVYEGKYNTAISSKALYSNTTGYRNTANGYHALYSNTTGSENTANGCDALYSNTTGYENTANGNYALYSNTTGYENTANGYYALFCNVRGYCNTANGYQALYINQGDYNTADGYYALRYNASGFYNTANGSFALQNNTTGFRNAAYGNGALVINTTGSFNTAIGAWADVSSGDLQNATVIGCNAIVDANNKVRIGNSDVTVIEGQVGWSVGSDIRLKNDVVYHNKLGLAFINDLKTVSFTYKNDSAHAHHDGLIAQDVQQTMDKLGVKFSGLIVNQNEEKILNLSYAEFVIPLINAVQEQQKQIEAQQKQIDELKQLVEILTNK